MSVHNRSQNLSLTQLSESLWPTCLHKTSHWHSFLNHCDLHASTKPLTDTAFWITVTYMPPQNLSLTQLSGSLWPIGLHRTSHWHSFLNHCDLHASTKPLTDTAFWITVTYRQPQILSVTQLSGSLWPTGLHRTSHWHSFLNHCDLHASTKPLTDTAFWIMWPTCLHRISHWHSFLNHCDLHASTEPLTDTAFWIIVTYMPPQNLSLTQLSESLWPTGLHKTSHWNSFLDHCDLHASTEPLTDTAFWITVTYMPPQNLSLTQISESLWPASLHRTSHWHSFLNSLWPTCLHRTSHWHSFLNHCDLHASTEPLTDTAFWIIVTYMPSQNLSLTQLSESLWPTGLHKTSHWHSFLDHCDLHVSTKPLTDTAFWITVTYRPPRNLSLTQLSGSLWPIGLHKTSYWQLSGSLWPTYLHRTSYWHSFPDHCDLQASTELLTDTAFWIIVTYMPPQNLSLTQLSESLWPTGLHKTSHWHSFLDHCDLHASTEPLTDSFLNHCDLQASTKPLTDTAFWITVTYRPSQNFLLTAFWIIVTYIPPQNFLLTQLSGSLWPTGLHRTSHWHSFLDHCDLHASTKPLTDTAFWITVTYRPPQNLSLTQLSESLWPTGLHKTSHWHSFLDHCDLHASTEPLTDTDFWIIVTCKPPQNLSLTQLSEFIVTYMPPQNLSLTQLSESLWPTCLHRTSHWHSFLNHCDLHASTEPLTDTAFWIIVTYMPSQNLSLTQLSESLWPTGLHKTSHWHSFLDHCDLHVSTKPLTDTAFWITVTYRPPQNLSLTQLSGSLWPIGLHKTSYWQLSGSLWPTYLHRTSYWHSFLDHCDLQVPSPCHGMDHVWKHPVWSVSFSSDSNKCVSCIAGW